MITSPEAVVQSQLEAYNTHDLEAWAATYALDAEQFEYPNTLLASGRTAIRERMVARFTEPNLRATLLNRMVHGNLVIDHERITRDFAEGPGTIDLVAMYEVQKGFIARARFQFGERTMTEHSGISLSSDRARFDVDAIHGFLSTSYWSPGVSREVVQRAIDRSICVGAFEGTTQIGFARAVTDRATFAYVADVYVLETHRGQGLSKQLMAHLLAAPELRGLRRIMLATRDAHALYAQFGFTPLAKPDRFMEIHQPEVYAAPAAAPRDQSP